MPRIENWNRRPLVFGRSGWAIGPAALLSVALLIGACSSDDPSAVGVGLVDREIDVLLDTVDMTELSVFRQIPISEPDLPLWQQEVLYVGEAGGNASSILTQYDLDWYAGELEAQGLSVADTINTVDFRLLVLTATPVYDVDADPAGAKYELYEVDAPIDSTLYPGAEPGPEGLALTSTFTATEIVSRVEFPITPTAFKAWIAEGGIHTFLIKAAVDSKTGLVGFSSMDMKHGGSTLWETADLDVIGIAINVTFKNSDTVISIPPTLDTSTFHELYAEPSDPAGGFFLRTGLRSYPALRFDLSALPENIFINRAVLAVANDTLSSWGTLESIVVSEMDPNLFGTVGDTLTLDELGDSVYAVRGMTSVDPRIHHKLEFNVTTSIQRMINGAYEGTRGFVLTAGEDFLPSYDTTTLDPDFYFNQFNFYGTADPDTLLRPRLKITYSSNETIQGGGK